MQTAQPHMGSRNSTWPLSLVFFASHTCFNQSEHLCRLVSKRAGRKKTIIQCRVSLSEPPRGGDLYEKAVSRGAS